MALTYTLLLWATLALLATGNAQQYPMVTSPTTALGRATAAISALQGFYNQTSGLWDTTGWWNSGNCLTVFADYASIDTSYASEARKVFANTFERAQIQELTIEQQISPERYAKIVQHGFRIDSPQAPTDREKRAINSLDQRIFFNVTNFPGFLNDFYDDEGWWALAWIRAYDVTGRTETRYLNIAISIFEDMTTGWSDGKSSKTHCEGLWWNKQQANINAIENELFLSVAAHLATRVGVLRRDYYLSWALKEWSWFEGTGMITSRNLINDGIRLDTCKNNGETIWTYNQGVVLGALVELNKVSPNPKYIKIATSIANAAIDHFSNENGIIKEICDPYCGADGAQFKGIFVRNLYYLWEVTGQPKLLNTITKNAESVWTNDRDDQNRFGGAWYGPYIDANAGTHSSASDAIVAAAKADALKDKAPANSTGNDGVMPGIAIIDGPGVAPVATS